MPRVIQVIESEVSRGAGVEGDPVRKVIQYHTLDGEKLAEYDQWKESYHADNLQFQEELQPGKVQWMTGEIKS